ncbi:uncharacterized protein LOC116940872 [Petromyzon marinus]|uniref:uncharacterized protein LOC116940872 n=1 Tax=Petromyzon marinus TaxID=7757 RepID=UPI003F70C248
MLRGDTWLWRERGPVESAMGANGSKQDSDTGRGSSSISSDFSSSTDFTPTRKSRDSGLSSQDANLPCGEGDDDFPLPPPLQMKRSPPSSPDAARTRAAAHRHARPGRHHHHHHGHRDDGDDNARQGRPADRSTDAGSVPSPCRPLSPMAADARGTPVQRECPVSSHCELYSSLVSSQAGDAQPFLSPHECSLLSKGYGQRRAVSPQANLGRPTSPVSQASARGQPPAGFQKSCFPPFCGSQISFLPHPYSHPRSYSPNTFGFQKALLPTSASAYPKTPLQHSDEGDKPPTDLHPSLSPPNCRNLLAEQQSGSRHAQRPSHCQAHSANCSHRTPTPTTDVGYQSPPASSSHQAPLSPCGPQQELPPPAVPRLPHCRQCAPSLRYLSSAGLSCGQHQAPKSSQAPSARRPLSPPVGNNHRPLSPVPRELRSHLAEQSASHGRPLSPPPNDIRGPSPASTKLGALAPPPPIPWRPLSPPASGIHRSLSPPASNKLRSFSPPPSRPRQSALSPARCSLRRSMSPPPLSSHRPLSPSPLDKRRPLTPPPINQRKSSLHPPSNHHRLLFPPPSSHHRSLSPPPPLLEKNHSLQPSSSSNARLKCGQPVGQRLFPTRTLKKHRPCPLHSSTRQSLSPQPLSSLSSSPVSTRSADSHSSPSSHSSSAQRERSARALPERCQEHREQQHQPPPDHHHHQHQRGVDLPQMHTAHACVPAEQHPNQCGQVPAAAAAACVGVRRPASVPVDRENATAALALGLSRLELEVPPARPTKGEAGKRALSIESLPDWLLLRVFANLAAESLCRCARVCRRWYLVAWDPRLWKAVTLGPWDGGEQDVERALDALTARLCRDTPYVCLTLESLVLSGSPGLGDAGLLTVARRCPELRRLEASGCPRITNHGILEVVTRCPNLEHLDVSDCPEITCVSLTPEPSCQACPLHGRHLLLRHLDMSGCSALTDEGLLAVARHCPRLARLYVRRCAGVSDAGLRALARHCGASLRELSLCDCADATDAGLGEVAAAAGPRLRYLSLAHCARVTDAALRHVGRHCPGLRYLNARGCAGVSDRGLEALARGCPRLRSLDVGRCPLVTDAGLEALARGCPGVKRLGLRGCGAVSGRGLSAVALGCRGLRLLSVQECDGVAAEALRFVQAHCPRCLVEHTNPASS